MAVELLAATMLLVPLSYM